MCVMNHSLEQPSRKFKEFQVKNYFNTFVKSLTPSKSWHTPVTSVIGIYLSIWSSGLHAQESDSGKVAFKVFDQDITFAEVMDENKAELYEIEKKRFDLIQNYARERYLNEFWSRNAKKAGKSVEAYQQDYFKKNAKVSDAEVKQLVDQYKDHPQLKELSDSERTSRIREFLNGRARQEATRLIIVDAESSGSLNLKLSRPQEPIYDVQLFDTDFVRFGPKSNDVKPLKNGCSGDDCAITVVEFSEFQCPYCSKVIPDIKEVLETYKGKIRWVIRDFPLSFHKQARDAAITARCAGNQGKYWEMYEELFKNQRELAKQNFRQYAQNIKLNMNQWDSCFTKNKEKEGAIVDKNFRSGQSLGVTGTPAFFINGRRLSGALPASTFKQIIDEELSKQKES